MRITLTTESGEVHNLELDSQMELENIKALIESEIGMAVADQVITCNGKELTDPKKTLEQYGVIQDQVLVLGRRPSSNQSSSAAAEFLGAEQMRQFSLSSPEAMQRLTRSLPELADAVNNPSRFNARVRQIQQRSEELQWMQQNNMDQFDVETQKRLEEQIRMENIMANMATAEEYYPESFGRVTMLYINVKINGHPVKAFVDSGAQSTIMSAKCAESCEITRLVDKRVSGIAKGVGTAKIIGRVWICDICVEDLYLPCTFIIMENSGVDLLFGLDMLKRHQACIDLKKNALVINGKESRFLAEHELPESARLEEFANDIASSSSAPNTKSSSISSGTVANLPSSNSSSQVSQQSKYPEEHIQNLVSMGGVSRDEAIKFLDMASGDINIAAGLLWDNQN